MKSQGQLFVVKIVIVGKSLWYEHNSDCHGLCLILYLKCTLWPPSSAPRSRFFKNSRGVLRGTRPHRSLGFFFPTIECKGSPTGIKLIIFYRCTYGCLLTDEHLRAFPFRQIGHDGANVSLPIHNDANLCQVQSSDHTHTVFNSHIHMMEETWNNFSTSECRRWNEMNVTRLVYETFRSGLF